MSYYPILSNPKKLYDELSVPLFPDMKKVQVVIQTSSGHTF
jgi:hypothetical protein